MRPLRDDEPDIERDERFLRYLGDRSRKMSGVLRRLRALRRRLRRVALKAETRRLVREVLEP
jgi:hypothetical protein